VFAASLDHGPVEAMNPGMHETESPSGGSLGWQNVVARTGAGAYHAIGGNVQGDQTIANDARNMPFGGLEVWAGGAFRFSSFPLGTGNVWLMATVPSDGVIGAGNKPVAAITPSGRLRLNGSNTPAEFAESQTVLTKNRWYYLMLHGRNGISQLQQLYIYDGQTDALIERLDLTLTVTGTFVNRLTKWGFGTSQDSTGLEYYLDDIVHARGPVNPGPIRVFSRTPVGIQATGFTPVGAGTGNEAVDDCAPDADSTFIASASDVGSHTAVFTLIPVPTGPSSRVYAVQVSSVGRSASSRTLTAQTGLRLGTVDATSSVTLNPALYATRQTVFRANPSTGQPWSVSQANAFSGLVKDADTLTDQMRFTTVWWEVVYGAPTA
jgi:hypothetical protein